MDNQYYNKMKLLEYFTHFLYYKAVWKLYPSFWENWSWKQQVTQCHVLVSRSKMELQFRAFDYKSHVFLLTSTALLGVDVNSWLHCTLFTFMLCTVFFCGASVFTHLPSTVSTSDEHTVRKAKGRSGGAENSGWENNNPWCIAYTERTEPKNVGLK